MRLGWSLVSWARNIDVTMTSQLLTLMMLTTLTSCQEDYDYAGEDGGQSIISIYRFVLVCLLAPKKIKLFIFKKTWHRIS